MPPSAVIVGAVVVVAVAVIVDVTDVVTAKLVIDGVYDCCIYVTDQSA
jgi:hypothetical protein